MARLRVGALIVVERSMRLGDMIKKGGRAAGRAPEQAAFDEYFLSQGAPARWSCGNQFGQDNGGRLYFLPLAVARGKISAPGTGPPLA